MAQMPGAKMHLRSVFILSVLVALVALEFCDEETHYKKDDQCCKKCWPGTKMVDPSPCDNPDCRECNEGDYQNEYTIESECKRQPSCDPNLFLKKQAQNKTKRTECVCISGYHCTSPQCESCVRNKECQPGEKISKAGTQLADTVCERCPNGTFSDQKSALTCKEWKTCSSGSEVSPGSSTADIICEVQSPKIAVVIPMVVFMFLALVLALGGIYFYRKGKTESISLVEKACTFWGNKNTHQAVQDNVYVENEPPQQPVNQPQEDTEDLVKHDVPLSPGISQNGMPVIQDHSKSLLLSETETEPGSCSVHL